MSPKPPTFFFVLLQEGETEYVRIVEREVKTDRLPGELATEHIPGAVVTGVWEMPSDWCASDGTAGDILAAFRAIFGLDAPLEVVPVFQDMMASLFHAGVMHGRKHPP